jgi:hypothetical protein
MRNPRIRFLFFVAIAGATASRAAATGEPLCPGEDAVASGEAALRSRLVRLNYIEIVYDAATGDLQWQEYDSHKPTGGKRGRTGGTAASSRILSIPIAQNTFLPPFATTKERLLVKVCDAKFQSDATVTTAVTNIPESTLEVRGLAATAASPAPGPASGTKLFAETVPTKETQTAIEELLNKPGGAAAASRYLRGLASLYSADYDRLAADLHGMNCGAHEGACEVGSLQYLLQVAKQLDQNVSARHVSSDAKTNAGAFALLAKRTSDLVVSLNNFRSSVDGLALTDRLVKLVADAETLAVTLGTAQNQVATQRKAVADAQAQVSGAKNDTEREAAQKELRDAQDALCALDDLARANEEVATTLREKDPVKLIESKNRFDRDARELHFQASKVFIGMNQLHEESTQTIVQMVDPTTSNGVVNIAIDVTDSFVPFGFSASTPPAPPAANAAGPTGAGQGTSAKPAAAADSKGAASTPATPPPSTSHPARRVLIEVHRLADVNIVSGFFASTIPQRAFSFTPYSGSTSTVVATQTQNDRFQFGYLIGFDIYLKRRDFFPGYLTPAMRWTPGIVLGTSVTATSNFMAGFDLEPVNGLDFYFGGHLGKEMRLAAGVTPGVTQFDSKTTSVPTRQSIGLGAFFGVGFDVKVFSAITSLFKGSSQ